MKMFKLWLYAYQTKARNPGNTVVATNAVFDLLITGFLAYNTPRQPMSVLNIIISIY